MEVVPQQYLPEKQDWTPGISHQLQSPPKPAVEVVDEKPLAYHPIVRGVLGCKGRVNSMYNSEVSSRIFTGGPTKNTFIFLLFLSTIYIGADETFYGP